MSVASALVRYGTLTGVKSPAQIRFEYAPDIDGDADPGEVVWAWVPYEDDVDQGKDRPVLIIARQGEALLGLQMTSKDHERDAEQEARAGRFWLDIGSGPWDSKGRSSEVRLNRLLRLDEAMVRREGSLLDEERFWRVIEAVRPYLA